MRALKSAVVTGPTGAVGTALCENMLEHGVRVFAVIRPNSPRRSALPAGVRVMECDLSTLDRLPEALAGERIDAFFHLGWSHTTGAGRNDVSAQIANIGWAVDAARSAKRLGCRVFVGAGSQAEYGRCSGRLSPETATRPETGYGIAKLCAGQMTRLECEKLGIAHVWVRILSVYGPRDREDSLISATIRELLAGGIPALTRGEQLWDFLYSADAAEALRRCALRGKDGGVYVLGSGEARPLRAYVEALRDAIDPGMPLDFGAIPYAPGQVMHLEADIEALTGDTGFVRRVGFEQGIAETIRWMREQNMREI